MQIGYKKVAIILLLHFYEVLNGSVIISQVQVSGRPDTTNNSFHAAKVSNFSIFGTGRMNSVSTITMGSKPIAIVERKANNILMIKLFLKKLHAYWLLFQMVLWFFILYPGIYYFSRKPERYWGLVALRRWWARLSTLFSGIFFRFEFEEPVDWNKTYMVCPYHTSNLDTM